MSAKFRWLHLSDIHFVNDPNDAFLHREILNKIQMVLKLEADNPIRCIVISGDFFLRGKPDDKLRGFLEELYGLCSEAGGWNWTKGGPMERLFICPGNHDLNRTVGTEHGEHYRPDELKELVEKHPDEFISQPDNGKGSVYDLMTERTFWKYKQFVGDIVKPIPADTKFGYECQLFQADENETPNPVVFVGINTALYAGQLRNKDAIKADAAAKYEEFLKYHKMLEYKKASGAYEEYSQYQEELIDGNLACDGGKLCFISSAAQSEIKEKIGAMRPSPLVIIFGHHSLDMLTKTAQQKEAFFASECNNAHMYLCGHSHQPGYKEVKTNISLGNSYVQQQICVGGSFADKSEYNLCSFSVGNIEWRNDSKVEASATLYVWKKIFDDEGELEKNFQWIEQSITGLTLGGIKSQMDKPAEKSMKKPRNIQKNEEEAQNVINNVDADDSVEPPGPRGPRYRKVSIKPRRPHM